MRSWPSAADVLVLAVKPARWLEVAPELGGAKAVVSLLGATRSASCQAAFPEAEVLRVMPNVGVEVRRGVLCVAGRSGRRGPREARPARARGRAADARLRRRDRGDGLRARLLRAGGRGDCRRRRRRRARRGAGRELVVETAAGTASCCGPTTRPTCARPSPRPGAAPRPGLGGARPRGRSRRPSRRRSGLAGEDAGVIAPRPHPRRRRRLRQRALPRLHHPDPAQRPDLLDAADALQPRRCGRCSTSSPRRPTPTSTSSAASCRRSAAAASRSTSAR